jgi:outer membrane murein-binding lipoprotein Lpp
VTGDFTVPVAMVSTILAAMIGALGYMGRKQSEFADRLFATQQELNAQVLELGRENARLAAEGQHAQHVAVEAIQRLTAQLEAMSSSVEKALRLVKEERQEVLRILQVVERGHQ